MFKKMTALLLTGTLLMGQMTLAAELSKLEYTKQLVKGLGFEVKSAEEAYNRKTSESEDIIYTAFQMGLLKGVSWDFENPMTEEEREIILGNAMGIHAENERDNSVVEKNVSDSDESGLGGNEIEQDQKPATNNDEIEWETQWGTIKQPTDFNVNDDIWTDEEFHNLLIDNPGMFKRSKIARSNENAEISEYWGDQWYYNTDTKHIMLRGEVVGKHDDGEDLYNYVDLDEVTNGRAFDIIKAVSYHGYKNNMGIGFYPQGDSDFLWIRLYEYDRGHNNLSLFIPYNSKKERSLLR